MKIQIYINYFKIKMIVLASLLFISCSKSYTLISNKNIVTIKNTMITGEKAIEQKKHHQSFQVTLNVKDSISEESLSNVSIILNNEDNDYKTDKEGEFIYIAKKGDKLIFKNKHYEEKVLTIENDEHPKFHINVHLNKIPVIRNIH